MCNKVLTAQGSATGSVRSPATASAPPHHAPSGVFAGGIAPHPNLGSGNLDFICADYDNITLGPHFLPRSQFTLTRSQSAVDTPPQDVI